MNEEIKAGNYWANSDNSSASDIALVDAGVEWDTTREPLQIALDEAEVGFSELVAIFLIHRHPDTAGLASDLQAKNDATVYAHP